MNALNADLAVRIKMAQVVITLRIMPSSPDVDLKNVENLAKREIEAFGGEVGKIEERPIAFGLKALLIYFIMDESRGSTEELEKRIGALEGVSSVEVVDVRRTIG